MLAIFKGLFTFFKPLFLRNLNISVKNKYGTSNFDLCRTFLVNKHYCVMNDVSDANGFKILTKIVLSLMLHLSTEKLTNSEDLENFTV